MEAHIYAKSASHMLIYVILRACPKSKMPILGTMILEALIVAFHSN